MPGLMEDYMAMSVAQGPEVWTNGRKSNVYFVLLMNTAILKDAALPETVIAIMSPRAGETDVVQQFIGLRTSYGEWLAIQDVTAGGLAVQLVHGSVSTFSFFVSDVVADEGVVHRFEYTVPAGGLPAHGMFCSW